MPNNPLMPELPFIPFTKNDIEQSIPQRFEAQVNRYPDRLAVFTRSEKLTYEALNHKANQVATFILKNHKMHREMPCILLLNQSTSLIVSIMGVLKSGNFYVPLDPHLNEQDNEQAIVQSGALLILTDNLNLDLAKKYRSSRIAIINVDTIDSSLSECNPSLNLSPDAPAYLFFTSGTSGQGKGVMDCHRNVLHNIMRYTNSLFINREDKLTLLQSCNYSGSVSSLFCALLNGACVYLIDIRKDGMATLVDIMREEKITLYHSVPSVFRYVAKFGSALATLRVIRLEGDQVKPLDIELFQTYFNQNCVLVNGLGMTECGLVRQYFVQQQTNIDFDNVPIGYEVEDMEILILSDSGKRLKVNKIGEIAVKSRYIITGYWNNPGQTRQVFSKKDNDGFCIYRTGDLGRLSNDGCLEVLGRKDSQVKIRGISVQLIEIEETLNRHPEIQESAVISFMNSNEEMSLVAYFVATPLGGVDLWKLRSFLLQKLPDYKVPAYMVALKKIPLTVHGKVNKKVLPFPNQQHLVRKRSYVAPRSSIQEKLANIWQEVFKINRIGIEDNFFELGGHSLLAMQLMLSINRQFQIDFPQKILFEAVTIADLSRQLEAMLNQKNSHAIEVIKAIPRDL